jgi:lysyl oxidase
MKRILILLVVVALPSVAMMLPATSLPAGSPHQPDMITRPPFGVRLVAGKGGVSRKLFFGNTIGNIGDGPLELRAENSSATGTTNAIQEIYTHGASKGGGSLILVSSASIGTFAFHPAHNHWHMGDFAQYELRSINVDGSTGAVVATTKKTSFCMIDTDTIDSSLTHFGMGLSHSCGQSARQGVKVGMGDTYSAFLSDQYIDITTIADGNYRLVSVADPNTADRPGGRLQETNDHNNAASVDVTITRTAITIIPGTARTLIDAP